MDVRGKSNDSGFKYGYGYGCLTLVLTIILALICNPMIAQMKKKRVLSVSDYNLWHDVQIDKLSQDGDWISYRLNYETTDTLFVRNTRNKKTIGFVSGKSSSFSKSYFSCLGLNNRLMVLDLKSNILNTYDNVYSYHITNEYLMYYVKDNGVRSLTICKPNGSIIRVLSEVENYEISPNNNELLIAQSKEGQYEVYLIKLESLNKKIIVHQNTKVPYQKLTWSKGGECIAFFSVQGPSGSVFYYDTKVKKISILDCSTVPCFTENRTIQSDQKITFSEDNKSLFFNVQKTPLKIENSKTSVQVWNAADKYIYPNAIETAGFSGTMRQVMWQVETGKWIEVNGMPLPFGGAIGNKKYALSYNPTVYEPQTESTAPVDYYLTELATGKQKLILTKQSGSDLYTMGSPEGKYVLYYKSPKWYVYDIAKEMHVELTARTNVSFADNESDRLGEPEAYYCAGWTTGDRSILLYDKFDVWEVFPDGKQSKRLTNGRENNIIYRVVAQNADERSVTQNRVRTTGKFDLNTPILLSAVAEDYAKSGYYNYSYTRGLEQIVFLSKRIRNAVQNESRDKSVFISESYDSPPEIMSATRSRITSIYKSNVQQQDFQWGKMKVMKYLGYAGQQLSGILYYPAGYDKNKKYPMIVHIYQRQYKQLHMYWTPTIYNDTGFNIANLSAQGYFVFLPDIIYDVEKGVGTAALACVNNALKCVSAVPEIDMSRIGLIGHSFGGYQTDYIISKSKLFSCAVAGAAMTNLISANLAVNRGVKRPNFFVVETGQPRIGGSVSEKRDQYIDNSPVFFADKISTPLLSWTGEEDTQVESRQSIELYMALRRHGKEHVMLIYPNEGHAISEKSNRSDLTSKIENWFAHYLKNKPAAIWMQAKE